MGKNMHIPDPSSETAKWKMENEKIWPKSSIFEEKSGLIY
jgi:hypothetical protein